MKTLKPVAIIGISVVCSVAVILGIMLAFGSYQSIEQKDVSSEDLAPQEQVKISPTNQQEIKEPNNDSEILLQINSDTMSPIYKEFDIVRIDKSIPFEDIEIDDVIAFYKPSGHDKLIVHRVVAILDDDQYAVRTKGDANQISIPGEDYPITENEYIGKVVGKMN